MNEITEIYHKTLEELKKGNRPNIDLNQDQQAFIKEYWAQCLKELQSSQEDLKAILCVLDHSTRPINELEEFFTQTLQNLDSKELIIFTLGSCSKHVITRSQLQGEPISNEFIQTLKGMISPNQDPEVLEWLLRTVESMGKQGLKFRQEVKQAKPSILGNLNRHKKACRQIIELLENQWSRYGF